MQEGKSCMQHAMSAECGVTMCIHVCCYTCKTWIPFGSCVKIMGMSYNISVQNFNKNILRAVTGH